MDVIVPQLEHGPIGRVAELSRISSFLAGRGVGAFVVTGAAGVGKTTVWEAALGEARLTGQRVLAARAAESVLPLSFAGLADLFAEIDLAAFPELAEPQRHALEVVLYRAEPGPGHAQLSAAAALGFVTVLRRVSAEQPVLVAVDDVTWLDRPSSEILAFAAPRLGDASIRFLFTRRFGAESELEGAFSWVAVEQLELGPLTLGAIRLLLSKRLALNLPRRLLRRLYDAANGNPLLALELARAPVARDEHDPLSRLPPARAEDLFGERVAEFPPSVRRALLAVALSPQLTESELAKIADVKALETALAAGLLALEGARLRVSHPLMAAAVRNRSSSEEQRALHVDLARSLNDPTRALQHAALGSDAADPALAARLTETAANSLARGRLHEAIELGQHAVRLTPAGDAALPDRLLSLAEHLTVAGEFPAAAALLNPRMRELPAGRHRARAHLLLGEAAALDEHERRLELAVEESVGNPDLVAAALSSKSVLLALIRVEQIEKAEALARDALAAARVGSNRQAEAQALHALAWTRILRGHSIDRSHRLRDPSTGSLYASALERPAAVRLAWRGELGKGRTLLERLLRIAEDRGEARSCVVLHLHLCELELRAGNTQAAIAALREWEGWTADEAKADVATIRARCRALLAAIQGRPEQTSFWADAAEAANHQSGFVWDRLEILRARALAALQAFDPETARSCLQPVWEHTVQAGVRDPGAFPVAGDLVETLLALGKAVEASTVAERLRNMAQEQGHPWALATAERCQALLRLLGEQNDESGLASLETVAADYLALGLQFDAARTLLVGGRAARRRRRWGEARALLGRAASIFDEIGADGWAETTRGSMGRQRSQPGELTSAEQRVAELVASGLSNKEIATHLTISVSTVETHLKRVYRKLDLHSRTQLARRITARQETRSG